MAKWIRYDVLLRLFQIMKLAQVELELLSTFSSPRSTRGELIREYDRRIIIDETWTSNDLVVVGNLYSDKR